MPQNSVSPIDLATAAGIEFDGSVPWGRPVPTIASGIYIVALHADPRCGDGLPTPPIDPEAIDSWFRRVPDLRIDGKPPNQGLLIRHISKWWLPDTSVLYIGKATTLQSRVRDYVSTPLGARGPHRGGSWLKTLMIVPGLTVHYAIVNNGLRTAVDLEDTLIGIFIQQYVNAPPEHPEPDFPLPWANLTRDRPKPRRLRAHGIQPSASVRLKRLPAQFS